MRRHARADFRLNNWVVGSLGEAYPMIHDDVMRFGYRVDSRLGPSMNLKNVTVVLTDPGRSLVERAGMKDAFALEETTQILAGTYDHDRMHAISPVAASLITPKTAYGPRVWPQLLDVERELRESPGTRRATVYVGRHDDLSRADDEDRAREMPCTKTLQFDLTDGRLDMTAEMRSNDAVWGFTYDVPCFTAIQRTMAHVLGVPVGFYYHKANSFHVYERHYALRTAPRANDRFGIAHLMCGSMEETRETAISAIS